jgi:hypothetical protein
VTPRLPLGPHPCNPFCLGREPKARVATASIQASPQAARKKRFTKLNLNFLDSPRVNNDGPVNSNQEKEDGSQESLARDATKETGSIGPKVAWNRLTYV